jgi:hypothetical protein
VGGFSENRNDYIRNVRAFAAFVGRSPDTATARRHRLRLRRGHARWRRSGKGEGYSDLEFAILRELGHAMVPFATTVCDLQIVASGPVTRPICRSV